MLRTGIAVLGLALMSCRPPQPEQPLEPDKPYIPLTDGIEDRMDRDDLCPDLPEDEDGFEDGDGCPDPDNDRDGVLDDRDRCPDSPGLDDYDRDGCPG